MYARIVDEPNALVRFLISWLRRMGEMEVKAEKLKSWNAESRENDGCYALIYFSFSAFQFFSIYFIGLCL
jgi:hypothetical protein